ncbi:MAG: glycosyltransferase family 1 protein [Candidatus Omnitrophota bacterium]
MRIGINARYIQGKQSGIGIFLRNLILNLKKYDRKNEYVLFFGDKLIPKEIQETGFECDVPKKPTGNQISKIMWAHCYLPSAAKRRRIDVFHETSFVAPIFGKIPCVTTVHDTAYLRFPYCYTRRNRLYFKALVPKTLKKSKLIIAPSNFTKSDIINTFSVKEEKIRVVYRSVNESFKVLDDKDSLKKVKQKYGIKGDFVLSVSAISPRKNLITAIKAFKLLKDKNDFNGQYVIVGGKGWLYEEVFKEVADSGLSEDIVFCEYVPEDDLVSLYNGASVFVYVSLFEGFGIPLVEAMACGLPIVTSNVSSMPEIAGKAARLVDPNKVEEIARAISDLSDKASSLRSTAVELGLKQAREFSWKKTTKNMIAVYEDAAVRR